jgi:hypothetical protein
LSRTKKGKGTREIGKTAEEMSEIGRQKRIGRQKSIGRN